MSEQVRVTSVDVLESFRASCILFLTKARQSLDSAGEEVRRTRNWVAVEQKAHWEGMLKRKRRALDQAEGELMSARMSEFIDSPSAQQAMVRKMRREVEEAEDKLRKIKHWNNSFDSTFDPLAKRMEGLRQFLEQDLPKAIAYLDLQQKTLISYAEIHAPLDPNAPVEQTESTPEPEPS
jgi:alkylhydroperoxidase family enzyme